jgi:LysM repeat protein
MKIQILLLGILMLTVAQATGVTESFVTEAAVIEPDAVDPVIDSSSFAATPEAERDYLIPYGFTGESIEFAVNVRDDDGASDITTVELILSDDTTISQDDTVIVMSHSANVDDKTATFIGTLTISSSSGLKHVFVNATDSTGSIATNNGINVGEVFENPLTGFEIEDGSGGSLASIIFPASVPGIRVESDLNSIQITNNDPSDVGMKIKVSVKGTPLISGTNQIDMSNMEVDTTVLSETLTEIDSGISAGATSDHNFYLNYPDQIASGAYRGNIDFEVEAV